ncbi:MULTISPECIES: zinc ribbon domain-containing protein [Butyrivibrio]|uniref:zinc ribbon domain-containing protein n=1 Tax=Butyrivibrio TaxID=830 RepID=UPI0003B50690|nr:MULTISPECIES: zinc ribbon domain-containing protein [Butyrivibrio]
MRFCTQCGKELSDGASFCTKCGAKMDAPSRAHRNEKGERMLTFEEACYDFADRAEEYADSMYDEEGIFSKDSLLTKIVGFIFKVIGSIIGYSIIPGIASFICVLLCVVILRVPFGDAFRLFFIPGLIGFAFICYFGKIIQVLSGSRTRDEYYIDRDGNAFDDKRSAQNSIRNSLRRERNEDMGGNEF